MADRSLTDALSGHGARLDPASGRPLHFGDPGDELERLVARCAIADRSHLGRILAAGPDAPDLLHRLSTADLKGLRPGEGRHAVLTTPKGRIVQRIFVHHLGKPGVMIVTGPAGATRTTDHLARFTFAEDTGLSDVTASLCQLALLGTGAREAAAAAGLPPCEPWAAAEGEVGGRRVHVLGEDGFSDGGVSILVPAPEAAGVWEVLARIVEDLGGRPAGDRAVEAWRILQGLPEAGRELTEEANPLEAGLLDAISFDKGCYVGQEVVARLKTYDKVARILRGFVLPPETMHPGTGAPVFQERSVVGKVTSAVLPPGRSSPVVLAYLKRRFARPGTVLCVGAENAPDSPVVRLPFGRTT